MDFELITQRLVVAARQPFNQSQLSHRLGFKFNVVNRWENGSRIFYWDDFLRLAEFKQWPVQRALSLSIGFHPSSLDSHLILKEVLSGEGLSIAEQTHNRQKLTRLINGSTKLQFSELLEFIENIYSRSETFLHHFVDVGADDIMDEIFGPRDAYRKQAVLDPSLIKVKLALEVGTYINHPTHDSTILAQLTLLNLKEVNQKLQILLDSGAIRRDPNTGKFLSDLKRTDNGARNPEFLFILRNHWRREIHQLTQNQRSTIPNFINSYLTYPTCDDLESKILRTTREYYLKVRQIIEGYADSQTDKIGYLGVDMYQPTKGEDCQKTSLKVTL